MSDGEAPARLKALRLLLRPDALWTAVSQAPMGARRLMLGYVLPFSAIGAVAAALGAVVLGIEVHGAFFHPPVLKVLLTALGMWGVSIAVVLLLAQAIKGFAGVFDADQRFSQALKLATFSSLPGWIAGVLLFASGLWPVVALGNVYGAFLLARGVGPVTGARQTHAVIYGGLIIAVFALLLGLASIANLQIARAALVPKVGQVPDGTLSVRGIGSLDLRQAKDALEKLREHRAQDEMVPSPPEALEALLPSELDGGFSRVEVSSRTVSAGDLAGSTAEAVFARDDDRITLEVSDAGAVEGLLDAVTLKSARSDERGYEKTGLVDGRMTIEKYDRVSHTGEYAVVIAGRYIVRARGRADIGTLKSAAEAVSWPRLEAMADG